MSSLRTRLPVSGKTGERAPKGALSSSCTDQGFTKPDPRPIFWHNYFPHHAIASASEIPRRSRPTRSRDKFIPISNTLATIHKTQYITIKRRQHHLLSPYPHGPMWLDLPGCRVCPGLLTSWPSASTSVARRPTTRKPSAPDSPTPPSPHEPHFQPGQRRMGKPSLMLSWPDAGGAAWLAFGPCRNPWLRARHRRKYLQFPQPPPNSSLFHRCQDISSLDLPHGAQKNDTPNWSGGCAGCFPLGPIPP